MIGNPSITFEKEGTKLKERKREKETEKRNDGVHYNEQRSERREKYEESIRKKRELQKIIKKDAYDEGERARMSRKEVKSSTIKESRKKRFKREVEKPKRKKRGEENMQK